jgi:hypothetical protein
MMESVTTGGISWMWLLVWLVFVLDVVHVSVSSRQFKRKHEYIQHEGKIIMKTSILAAAIVASALSATIVSAQDRNGPEGDPGGMMGGPGGPGMMGGPGGPGGPEGGPGGMMGGPQGGPNGPESE